MMGLVLKCYFLGMKMYLDLFQLLRATQYHSHITVTGDSTIQWTLDPTGGNLIRSCASRGRPGGGGGRGVNP